MITFFTMRDLNISQHQNLNYVIVLMYFVDVKNDNSIKIFICREIHLINNFKINMFIDNDVIVSKSVVFNLIKKQVFIDNCNVIIIFNVRLRINYVQQRFIHVKKIIVLSSRNQMIIFIYHFVTNCSSIAIFYSNLTNQISFYMFI